MESLRLSFATLLLLYAVNASRSLESARDQYKTNKDVHYPLELLSEATDQTPDIHKTFSTDDVPKLDYTIFNFHRKTRSSDELSNERKQLLKRLKAKRHRRSSCNSKVNKRMIENYYNPWNPTQADASPQLPPLESYSVWPPQVYKINRPYYIPVWGKPGNLLYFPPQPLYANPGYPIDNPPNRQYLPPDSSDNSTVPTMNKFDDSQIWDSVQERTTTTIRPTRRTRPPGQTLPTHPSLVHNDALVGNHLSVMTTTSRPVVSKEQQLEITPIESAKQPSRCVWAIISCCSANSEEISYSCFEQLGCTGAFWDTSPCESEFARAAIQNIMKYYETN